MVESDRFGSSEESYRYNYALQPGDVLPTNSNTVWAYYSKSPGAVIHYIINDGEELFTSPTIVGELNDLIPIQILSFPGYRYLYASKEQTFTQDKQSLDVVYEKIETSSIIINYIDKQGNQLLEQETISGEVGSVYNIVRKDIDGYRIIEVQGNEQGMFTQSEQVINYIYEAIIVPNTTIGKVIVKHIDKDGNEISEKDIIEDIIGNSYITQPKNIEGYMFDYVLDNSDPVSGVIKENDQIITYVYEIKEQKVDPKPSTNPIKPNEDSSIVKSKPILPPTGVSTNNIVLFILVTGIGILIINRIYNKKAKDIC